MKYIYNGPASGVTLADGQEILLWPNSEIDLYRIVLCNFQHEVDSRRYLVIF